MHIGPQATVFLGRQRFASFKKAGKIARVFEADGIGDLADRLLRRTQQLLGMHNALKGQVFRGRLTVILLELPLQVAGAEAKSRTQLGKRAVFLIRLRQIYPDLLHDCRDLRRLRGFYNTLQKLRQKPRQKQRGLQIFFCLRLIPVVKLQNLPQRLIDAGTAPEAAHRLSSGLVEKALIENRAAPP